MDVATSVSALSGDRTAWTPCRLIEGVREATIFGHSIHALAETGHLDALRNKIPGARVDVIEPSLEDVFVTLTYRIMEQSR